MRKAITYSLIAHAVVAVIGYVGLPALRQQPLTDHPMIVDLVMVSDETNAPPPKAKQRSKKVKKQPPPPAPKVATPPPSPPPAKPEPKVAAEPAPKSKAEPKPKSRKQATLAPKTPPSLIKAKPRRKPKAPDPFASVLRTVEKLKQQQPHAKVKDEDKQKQKQKETFEDQMARAIPSTSRQHDSSRPLSISEIDLVRQQIARCWSLPAGAKDAENLIIEIRVQMNPDGTVRQAEIVDQSRLASDRFFRSAAESAFRAVLNKRCQPYKLPRDKYERWRTMTLVFNPKEMFGA